MVNKKDISGSTATVPSEPPPPSVIDDSSEATTESDQDAPASIEAEVHDVETDEAPGPPEENLEHAEEMEAEGAKVVDTGLAKMLAGPEGLRAALEALLFTSPEPLGLRRICNVLEVGQSKQVREAITALREEYEAGGRGIQIIETAGGWQMGSREEFADLILRLRGKKRRPPLSMAALETVGIVAYRQPIIRAEIEAIRGVECSGTLRNLMDMGLVEIVGRKDVIGRPPMYGTTDAFLQAFGLKSLNDLPPISELKRQLAEMVDQDRDDSETEPPDDEDAPTEDSSDDPDADDPPSA